MDDDLQKTDYLRQLMDNMTDHIFFKDKESRFIMINEASAQLLGVDNPREVVGKTDFDLFTEEFAQESFEDERQLLESGVPMVAKEEHAVWKNGHEEWVSTTKIPLRDSEGKIVGCIGIGRDITEQKCKEQLIKDYANQLAETNAKLKASNDQMAEDLRLAGNLQSTFLPQSYPVFVASNGERLIDFYHYYEASSQVGGDLCSTYQLSETAAGIHVYDVMGHGVRAALVTAIIRAIERELTHRESDPGKFFTEMNRQLVPMLQANEKCIFATASFLVIDVEIGELSGASAGHLLPILIRPSRREVCCIEVGEDVVGPALGILDEFEFESFRVQLETGDSVLMYTDGLIEATNEAGEEFGLARLLETIRDHIDLDQDKLVETILSVVRRFSSDASVWDDVCTIGFTLR